jgi:hypothetical protein
MDILVIRKEEERNALSFDETYEVKLIFTKYIN